MRMGWNPVVYRWIDELEMSKERLNHFGGLLLATISSEIMFLLCPYTFEMWKKYFANFMAHLNIFLCNCYTSY